MRISIPDYHINNAQEASDEEEEEEEDDIESDDSDAPKKRRGRGAQQPSQARDFPSCRNRLSSCQLWRQPFRQVCWQAALAMGIGGLLS